MSDKNKIRAVLINAKYLDALNFLQRFSISTKPEERRIINGLKLESGKYKWSNSNSIYMVFISDVPEITDIEIETLITVLRRTIEWCHIRGLNQFFEEQNISINPLEIGDFDT